MKQRKPTRIETLSASAARSNAHLNTEAINSRRRILEFEGSEVDQAIVALQGALANSRRRRAEIDAMLSGLASVIEKRW